MVRVMVVGVEMMVGGDFELAAVWARVVTRAGQAREMLLGRVEPAPRERAERVVACCWERSKLE